MDQNFFEYDELVLQDTKEFTLKFLINFESDYFDIHLQKLFIGIMDQNWSSIQKECMILKGKSNFVFMKKLTNNIFELLDLIYQYKTITKSKDQNCLDLQERFNDEVKLQAMDFIIPIFQELRLLKFEISKYTKSEVPKYYLQKEKQIRELHENMKKEYQKKQSESQTNNPVITELIKPENASCTDICIIF